MSFSRLRASSRYGKPETQRRWQAWCSLRSHPAKYRYDSAVRCHPGPSTAAGSERQTRRTRTPKQRFAGRSAAENPAKRAHSTHYRIDASPKIRWMVFLAATGSTECSPIGNCHGCKCSKVDCRRRGLGRPSINHINTPIHNTQYIITRRREKNNNKKC